MGELRKGVAAKQRTDPLMAAQLAIWVNTIETTFADRIVPIDAAIAKRWGELSAKKSLPVVDALIAATAISHGFTLVTRNTRDVVSTGVTVIDPWQAQR